MNTYRQMTRSKVLSHVLAFGGACMILVLFFCVLTFQQHGPAVGSDGLVYYHAARHALAGEMFYPPTALPPDVMPAGYLYAPWVLFLYIPFAFLSPFIYTQIILLVNFACFLVFALVMARLSGQLTIKRWLIWCFLISLIPITYENIMMGQINPFLWVLAGLAVLYNRSPLAWVFTGGIKPFCIFPVVAGRYSWRSIVATLIVVIAGIVGSGMAFGWDSYSYWMQHVIPSLSQGNFHHSNISLPFYLVRLAIAFHLINYQGGMLPHYVQMFLSFCSICAPIGVFLGTRRLPDRWRMCLIVIAAAWCAPLCWGGYLLCGAPLVALVWERWMQVTLKEEREVPSPMNYELLS